MICESVLKKQGILNFSVSKILQLNLAEHNAAVSSNLDSVELSKGAILFLEDKMSVRIFYLVVAATKQATVPKVIEFESKKYVVLN